MNSSYIKSKTASNLSFNLSSTNQYEDQFKSPQINRSPMITRTPLKNAFYQDSISKNSNKKAISFSKNSPIRYSIPESFKTPPSPNKFKDDYPSSILRSKKTHQNYGKQVILTPTSRFKATFNEKSQDLTSSYSYYKTNRNNNQKNVEKNIDSCQSLVLVTFFLLASCIVALTLIWI